MSVIKKLRKLFKSPNLFLQDMKKKFVKKYIIVHHSTPNNNVLNINNHALNIPKQFKSNKDIYLYMPWIASHGDKLIQQINISDHYEIHPLDMFMQWDADAKSYISRLATHEPEKYRMLLLQYLIPFKKTLKGFIFTFDWHPAMRILSKVCEELGIPRILVLHESVFLDQSKYYWHESSDIKMPLAEHILCWGNLQKDIFLERGVDTKKLHIVGAPKFDIYHNYQSALSRDIFYGVYGLNSNKKTILFALQPMDAQVDEKQARASQVRAVNDIMDFCEIYDYQLILREPPAKVNVIYKEQHIRVLENSNFFIDQSSKWLTSPEETIYHSDVVVSINSTMLFEATLMQKAAISAKYIDFEQIWNNIGIPFATHKKDLHTQLAYLMQHGTSNISDKGWAWAKKNLSSGEFDGKASERVQTFLEQDVSSFTPELQPFLQKTEKIAISSIKMLETTGKYLPYLLNTNMMYTPNTIQEASWTDGCVQWGNTLSNTKIKLFNFMRNFGKKPFIIEDGFIRSVGIGLSGEAALSISLCGDTAYYDAYQVSNFEKLLNSDRIFNKAQLKEAKDAIDLIIKHKISKYNNSPILPINIGTANKKKVLLVDQRFGDQSIESAMANQDSFKKMLIDAILDNPDHDIIIKRHPDAVKGGKGSCFNDDLIAFTKHTKNVHVIDYDIHPHQLLEIVDKVYVVSSGLGMEALLYNKEVYCYGVPFYSNWGVTQDKIKFDRRDKKRTVEEIFYVSFIECSRYYSPKLQRNCTIEECIDYIVTKRDT